MSTIIGLVSTFRLPLQINDSSSLCCSFKVSKNSIILSRRILDKLLIRFSCSILHIPAFPFYLNINSSGNTSDIFPYYIFVANHSFVYSMQHL